MRITIHGCRFDTEAATKIATRSGPNWGATLYQTPRSGKYFIAGDGDWLSVFGGRARIIPITDEQVLHFMEGKK